MKGVRMLWASNYEKSSAGSAWDGVIWGFNKTQAEQSRTINKNQNKQGRRHACIWAYGGFRK